MGADGEESMEEPLNQNECDKCVLGRILTEYQDRKQGNTDFVGRLVVAHKSTMNMLERTRPKGLMKGYAGGSGS